MAKKEKNNFIYKIISYPFIKWVVIPFILLFLWLSASLVYSSYRSFTVIQYPHNLNSSDDFNRNKLLKGQSIKGQFTAEDNNLGIIEVRFGDIPKPAYDLQDTLSFKIREVGENKWLAENMYKSGAITPFKYFPFGFNMIADSKGKNYEFQIESLNGNLVNAVSVSRINPVYLSKYKFSKAEVLGGVDSILVFTYKKVITFFSNSDALISSTVFLLPFIFYILWIIFPIDRLVKTDGKFTFKKMFQIFIAILVISDATFYEFLSTGFMLGLLGLWLISIYMNKSSSRVTLWFAFALTIYSILGIYFKLPIYIDKSSAFAYFFLVIGFVQSVIESKSLKVK